MVLFPFLDSRFVSWQQQFLAACTRHCACAAAWLYPRRLRRITAAPCPFGSASVADSWARAWPSYLASCSPSRFGKTSGNAWGSKKRSLGGLWGLRGCLFGRLRAFLTCLTPSEAVLGASLNRLGALLGRFRAVLEVIFSVLEASWAVLGPSWGRLGGLLGRHGAILEASWAIFGRPWGPLGPSWAVGRPKMRKCKNHSKT